MESPKNYSSWHLTNSSYSLVQKIQKPKRKKEKKKKNGTKFRRNNKKKIQCLKGFCEYSAFVPVDNKPRSEIFEVFGEKTVRCRRLVSMETTPVVGHEIILL